MISLVCDNELRQHIQRNLSQFVVQAHDGQNLKRAAVTVMVVDIQEALSINNKHYDSTWKDQAALVLTRRATKLKKHSGQWALPGGRLEAGESAEVAALRELEEEVGVHLETDAIMGRLDDFTTRSGFVMTPIVVWGGTSIKTSANPDEVASVHRIPVREFMRDDAPLLEEIPESEHPVLRMPVGEAWIAAPTGAILYQFREVGILGKDTRVAHYEQPYFAWR
ncbi:MAG: CoA pyrophosphatase [Chloroflexota bacterium]